MICDGAMEKARAALLVWRNTEAQNVPANQLSWNILFQHAKNIEGTINTATGYGTGLGEKAVASEIMKSYITMERTNTWPVTSDASYNYGREKAVSGSVVSGPTAATDNVTIGDFASSYQDLFCKIRRYGKGAYHMVLKNNYDYHGDGTDSNGDGDYWDADTLAKSALKLHSDVIDGDKQAILIVTAMMPDGTTKQTEYFLAYPAQQIGNGGAISTNGNINMQGSFQVLGTQGSVQANQNLTGNGAANASISVAANASGSATISMQNIPPGGINSGVDPVSIPVLPISSFRSDPAYSALQNRMIIFDRNGNVSSPTGSSITAAQRTAAQNYFNIQVGSGSTNTQFKMSGNSATPPPNAVYYFEGDFVKTGQGNAPEYPMTIVAEGSVKLAGNAKFSPATYDGQPTNSLIPSNSMGQLILAGQDVELMGTGSTGNQYTGNVFANEQARVQGNFQMNGSITAADAPDTVGSAVTTSSSLSPDVVTQGNPVITYDGIPTFLRFRPDHINVTSIRRLR
jgi:hypothetical protein